MTAVIETFRAVSVKDALAIVGVSETVLRDALGKYRAVNAGEVVDVDAFPPPLRSKKTGRTYSIRMQDLEAWWESLPDA